MLPDGEIVKEEDVGELVKEEDVEFCWGEKMTVGNKNVQFYKSFMLDGVTYSLYDSVYIWGGDEPEPEPFIGKVVKMWETPAHTNLVKIIWFFRPCEIKNFLRDVELLEKEIFLACGEGKGLFKICSPEAIAGKCKVICTTTDERNPQVSTEELRMANHIFYRTFNVGNCKISERFPYEIAGLEVVQYFNRKTYRNIGGAELEEKKRNGIVHLKGVPALGNLIKDEPEEGNLGKRPCSRVDNDNDRLTKPFGATGNLPMKKRKVQFNLAPEYLGPSNNPYLAGEEQGRGSKTSSKPFVVTKKPDEEKRKWFRQQPWEVKMQTAHETGTLVLLENLDPSYTSSEIEDILWNALNQKVDAKMIHRRIPSSSHYGKALVVFKSKDSAEAAISILTKKCLVLTDGRAIVASKGYPKNLSDKTKFQGHLIIDRKRYQKQFDRMKEVVSTAHYSQPNTIEHELALEWCALQEKSTLSWNALNEQQEKEREELQRKLKTSQDEQGLHYDT